LTKQSSESTKKDVLGNILHLYSMDNKIYNFGSFISLCVHISSYKCVAVEKILKIGQFFLCSYGHRGAGVLLFMPPCPKAVL
jgi:hypothetical protein